MESKKIAVLSGKGGTGKTFVSVNLADAAGTSAYIDCDVEEPNGHLFFKPEITAEEKVAVKIPVVDHDLCTGCRKCTEFCRFNALAYLKDKVKVLEDICHSCGGCALVCPQEAIYEKDMAIGKVEIGKSQQTKTLSGMMGIGKASGVPIIKRLLELGSHEDLTIIDCPPGSACVTMESIKDADFCVLVAEPTLFGVHNLAMVHELVNLFKIPFGAVLNKCTDGENPAEKYCDDNDIKILGKFDYDKEMGRQNSQGEIISRVDKTYNKKFTELLYAILEEVK
ncbi:4Fe-4S binding protein [Alkalibacter saccharofermentans]|nr:ATP-binding protein [Alkalibacter saccharofermentans]